MINKIIELSHNFLDHPEYVIRFEKIQDYKDDFCFEIKQLFLSSEIIEKLSSKYDKLLKTREILSNINELNDIFVLDAKNWLTDIKSFLTDYFEYKGNKDEIVSNKILEQIVHSDCYYDSKKNKLSVGVGHPMVLMSLLIAYYQRNDLFSEREMLRDEDLNRLDSELYYNKFDRLFRDIIILYNKEFYRIIDAEFDIQGSEIKDLRFIAEKENNLTSIEPISATRLFEKIKLGLDIEKRYKVLLVGDFIERIKDNYVCESTVADLAKMLSDFGYGNIQLFHCDKTGTYVYTNGQKKEVKAEENFYNIFTRIGINNCIKNYDKVFIMDCPNIYREITLCEMKDTSTILYRSRWGINDCLETSLLTGRREYSHKNSGFASIFYRVQNYLLDINKPNLRKTRKVNEKLLKYIQSVTDAKEGANSNKEVFVYISNNADFENEYYNNFNITRNERYNSKDCKIIKFGNKEKLPEKISIEHELHINLYKLLKMISPSCGFHKYFTCVKDKEASFSDYAKISRSVDICIKYFPVIYSNDIVPPKINLDIIINSKYDSEIYKKTERLVREMFAFDNDSKANIIKYCYKKAVANVFSGNVRNFNDCLFYHFYNRKLLGQYNYSEKFPIEFCIKSINGNDNITLKEFNQETYNYSFKRLAYSLMDILDEEYYNENKLYEHMYQARLNENDIDYYVDGLLYACKTMNYANSNLVYRLMKYYR